jgi:hypothetical protein
MRLDDVAYLLMRSSHFGVSEAGNMGFPVTYYPFLSMSLFIKDDFFNIKVRWNRGVFFNSYRNLLFIVFIIVFYFFISFSFPSTPFVDTNAAYRVIVTMHILHHKSWNVYNADNIAKVKKDEQKAQDEEKRKQAKAEKAEQEYRLHLLRAKAHNRSEPLTDQKHVNFFTESAHHNQEYEQEKQKEQQKQELQCTTYLVSPADGSSSKRPWYVTVEPNTSDDIFRKKIDMKKQREDPLLAMYPHHQTRSRPASHRNNSQLSSLEHLREQRLRREKEERERIAILRGIKHDDVSFIDDRKRPYHSQFHPKFSK